MIIGVAAVVVVVSLIQGFNTYVDEKIAGIGAKSYTIQRFGFDDWKDTDSIAAAQRRNKDLTLEDYEYLRTRLTLTDKFGAGARPSRSQVKRGAEVIEEVPVDGAMAIIGDIEKVDVADGRYFTASEDEKRRASLHRLRRREQAFPAWLRRRRRNHSGRHAFPGDRRRRRKGHRVRDAAG